MRFCIFLLNTLLITTLIPPVVFADEKQCELKLNTEYPAPGEKDSDASRVDSFANLTLRMKRVMGKLADKDAADALNPKLNHDTYTYGRGGNTLQPGDLRRAFHAKAHGCVDAEFRVDYDLSQTPGIGSDLGIFNKASGHLQKFKSVVRLSNARGSIQSDSADDLRGFAIKLLNVEGERVVSRVHDEDSTQDFLFTNAPVHFAKDPAEMVRFAEFMLNPVANLVKGTLTFQWSGVAESMGNAIKASKDIKENRTGSLLTARYYSRAPFMVGKKAAKLSVTPAPCDWWTAEKGLEPYTYRQDPEPTPQPKWAKSEEKLNFNYLREDLIKKLSPDTGQDVCFDFNVQFQADACKQPIESADVEWKRNEAPVIRVGQIRIPKQVFTGDNGLPNEKDNLCENTNYNPWHALAAHKPIGGMNRAREDVYYELQKTRSAGKN